MTKARELPPDEWYRLQAFGPFRQAGVLPNPEFAKVVVLEDEDGVIVGSWMTTTIPLLEGLYIEAEHRGTVASRQLFMTMLKILRETDAQSVITVTQDPLVTDLAHKVGFQDLPGSLHVLMLKGGH